jgi:two-component system cell cycle sensor histidine kinase PleC
VVVTFPPERVMSALGPLTEEAPPLQPETTNAEAARIGRKPILSAGTGL